MITKDYMGDSIYIEDKGSSVALTTENGMGAVNTIHIEPAEWKSIQRYMKRVEQGRAERNFDAVIDYCFDFYEHLDDPPTIESRTAIEQDKLYLAFVSLMGAHDSLYSGLSKEDMYATIDQRITELFDAFCDSHGRYSLEGRDEPSELIGFDDGS